MKKILIYISVLLITSFGTLNITNGGFFDFLGTDGTNIPYCNGGDCSLEKGVNLVKGGIKDVRTDIEFTDYIQEVIVYLLSFITLIAVIYVIYAGFRILVSSGEEETIKNAKNTIIYVIVGILIIWFAWAIANFAIGLGNTSSIV